MTAVDSEPSHGLRRSGPLRTAGGLAVALACLSAVYWYSYGDCIGAFFYLDDWGKIAAAAIHVQSPADLLAFFVPDVSFMLYRPLSQMVYFYLLHACFGYDPTGYHAVQLGFHMVNALLVYAITDALLRSRLGGLAAALVYATAPGHVLAVYWNSAFSITGTACFYFLAIWIWVGADSAWRRRLTFLLFGLALLASEHAASLPLALTAISILLPESRAWRRMLRQLAPFYALDAVYIGAKLYYLRYQLPITFPNPMARAYVLSGYQPSLNPGLLLGHLGQYIGAALDAASPLIASDSLALGLGIALLVGACVATMLVLGRQCRTRALRVVTIGVDLFIVGLGPVVVLPRFYGYYVGIGALGMALAIAALADAVPRGSKVALAAVMVTCIAVHVWVTLPQSRHNENVQAFFGGSRIAAQWLYAVRLHSSQQAVSEIVVPENPLTHLLFTVAEAHKRMLCASYDVRVVRAIRDVPPAADRLILLRSDPVPLPRTGQRRWFWIPRDCAA